MKESYVFKPGDLVYYELPPACGTMSYGIPPIIYQVIEYNFEHPCPNKRMRIRSSQEVKMPNPSIQEQQSKGWYVNPQDYYHAFEKYPEIETRRHHYSFKISKEILELSASLNEINHTPAYQVGAYVLHMGSFYQIIGVEILPNNQGFSYSLKEVFGKEKLKSKEDEIEPVQYSQGVWVSIKKGITSPLDMVIGKMLEIIYKDFFD